ncbi:MAG TPA: hypothetical protein VL360_01055 [Gammaproteobacteria bacterium]|nr:hypothetical protein [Gammaproteobacteria bacterium]
MESREDEKAAAKQEIDNVITAVTNACKPKSNNDKVWEDLYVKLIIASRHYKAEQNPKFDYKFDAFKRCFYNVLYERAKLNFESGMFDLSLQFSNDLIYILDINKLPEYTIPYCEMKSISKQSQKNIELLKRVESLTESITSYYNKKRFDKAFELAEDYLALYPRKNQQGEVYQTILKIRNDCLTHLPVIYYDKMKKFHEKSKYGDAKIYAEKYIKLFKKSQKTDNYREAKNIIKFCSKALKFHFDQMHKLYKQRDFTSSLYHGSTLLSYYESPPTNDDHYDKINEFVKMVTREKNAQPPAVKQYKLDTFRMLPAPRDPSAITKSLDIKRKPPHRSINTRMTKSDSTHDISKSKAEIKKNK